MPMNVQRKQNATVRIDSHFLLTLDPVIYSRSMDMGSTVCQAVENGTKPLGTFVFLCELKNEKQYLRMQQGPTFKQTKISEDEIFRLLVQPYWSVSEA